MTTKKIMKKSITELYAEHPALTFQNNGYQYIDKSTLSEKDINAIKEIEEIIRGEGFKGVTFYNFIVRNDGTVDVRFDANYDPSFIGVHYIPLVEFTKTWMRKPTSL